jgi:hypothetical protein
MATFSIAGNVIANNARLRLTPINYVGGVSPTVTYSNSSGAYTFSGVTVGKYQIAADLNEVTASPYNTGYSYRKPQIVTVIDSNLTGVDFGPTLINASN